jgi:hypothetical protein
VSRTACCWPATCRWSSASSARSNGRLARGQRIEDPQNGRPEIRSALERAQKFLGLAALLTVVLAAVAVALASRRYVQRHLDPCAVMRCLGATQALLLRLHLGQFAALGLLAAWPAVFSATSRISPCTPGWRSCWRHRCRRRGRCRRCRASPSVCCCSSASPCRPCCSSTGCRRCASCDANSAVRRAVPSRLSARLSRACRTDVLGGRRSRTRRLGARRLQPGDAAFRRRGAQRHPAGGGAARWRPCGWRGQGSAGVTGWRASSGAPTPASCRSSRWRSASWRCCC